MKKAETPGTCQRPYQGPERRFAARTASSLTVGKQIVINVNELTGEWNPTHEIRSLNNAIGQFEGETKGRRQIVYYWTGAQRRKMCKM